MIYLRRCDRDDVYASFLGEGLKDAMELGAAAGESGNNILGGRLKESHNIGVSSFLLLMIARVSSWSAPT